MKNYERRNGRMLKKIISLTTAVIMLCLCLASCGDDESTVLFMPVESAAGTLDPQIASDITALIMVRNCFEGLVRKNSDGEIVPGVAESWDISSDGKTYTFYLRKDAKWHLTSNAQEELEGKLPEDFDLSVTADDFVFGLTRALDSDTGSWSAFLLGNIVNAGKENKKPGIRAIDRYTLEIKLSVSQSNFLEILTEPVCMPCNETFFNACTGRYGRYIKYLLTNGPFYVSRLYEDSYRINKNPDYVGDFVPSTDAVWLYCNSDRTSVVEKLQDGDYSCALLSSYEYDSLTVTEDMTVTESSNVLRCFVMNLDDEVVSNANIRRALSAATDNARVAENAGMTPAEGIVPSCSCDREIENHPEAYDEEKAPSYFSKGLEELGTDSVTVEILCEKCYENTVKLLIQQWQKILGIRLTVTIRTCMATELKSEVKKGNYQIAFDSIESQSDSAWGFFASFTENSPYNSTGYTNSKIPGYLFELYSGDGENYAAVYGKIEKLLLSASFILPIWEENSCFVTNSASENIVFLTGSDKIYFK